MLKILALAAVLATTACGKHDQLADVDCGKLMDHMTDLAVKGGADRQKMVDQRPALVAACEKEKPTKKMTVAQYDCVMKAPTLADLNACQ